MAASTRIQVVHQVRTQPNPSGHTLCFQWVRYPYADGGIDEGYRFIWRNPNGNMIAHRGQARIPSRKIEDALRKAATDQGWGNLTAMKPDEEKAMLKGGIISGLI